MLKLKLKHIGVVSLGKIIAIWTFIISELTTILMTLVMLIASLMGAKQGFMGMGGGIVGTVMAFLIGSVISVIYAIFMFIVGAIMAVIYNIIIGVGGGLDLDFDERQ